MNEIANPFSRLTNVYASHWYQRYAKLVDPFKQCFGLDVCGYTLVDDQGKYFQIYNHPELCQYYYETKGYLQDPFHFHPSNYKSGVLLPYSLGLKGYNEPHEDMERKFKVSPNYLMIQRKGQGFAHCFDFSSTQQGLNLTSIYVQNLRCIERFVDFFLSEWSPEEGLFDPYSLNMADLIGKQFYQNYKDQIYQDKDSRLEFGKMFQLQGNEVELYQMLTKREKQCFGLLFEGYTTIDMADEMNLSKRTVEQHLDNIRFKLDCGSRVELIRRFNELKILGLL